MKNRFMKNFKLIVTIALIASLAVPSACVYAATDEGREDKYMTYVDNFVCVGKYETAPELVGNLKVLDEKLK